MLFCSCTEKDLQKQSVLKKTVCEQEVVPLCKSAGKKKVYSSFL